jgi:DNA polymerase-1
MEDVADFREWLGRRRPRNAISFDTESTGLNKQTDTVRLIQFGDAEHGWAMSFRDWRGVAEDVFRRFDGMFDTANGSFDRAMCRNMDMVMPDTSRFHDVRAMTHPLDGTQSTALKSLATKLVDPRAADAQTELKQAIATYGWDGVPIDFPPYWIYAAEDCVLTTQVTDVLLPQVQEKCPKAYDLELSTMWVTDRMESYGAHVDQAYVRRALDEFEQFVEEAGKWCKDVYGVSAGSNQQIVNALVAEGHNFTERTATGLFKLDKDILSGIDHPLAQTVLKRRQVEKLAKSYLRHFSEESDGNDLIHCSINTIGARTGRMSITHPALQTLPRANTRNAAAQTVRNCISARPGHTLLMCDFDQIEMRVLAYLSEDQGMRDAFLSGRDFFITMACQIYDIPGMEKSDSRRQLTKNTCYGKVYGAGIQKLSETAGVLFTEAKNFMEKFDGSFPGITTYIDELMETAQQNRTDTGTSCVFSPLTGRRHVADRFKEYALTNYMIQGLAAELFKTKLLEIDASGLGEWLMLPVHDEVILDVPHEHVPHAVATLERIMNDANVIAPIPVTASVAYGLRWGQKREWEDERTWRDLLVQSDAA